MARQIIAKQAIKKAAEKMGPASDLEKAIIGAYEARCTNHEVDQAILNEAYMKKMQSVYDQFGDHPEVSVLFAASVMNTMPWNYYDEHLKPKPMTV
ncbi:MAG: hypothetical protein HKN87_04725 [Saprospiraceae bacterium]|nr:hypothetical protein [Saprospiraceae bacterium]